MTYKQSTIKWGDLGHIFTILMQIFKNLCQENFYKNFCLLFRQSLVKII